MLDEIKRFMQQSGELFKEQAESVGRSAKEKTLEWIDAWLQVFPKLDKQGLRITSFGIAVAISPSMEVELAGLTRELPYERVKALLEDSKGDTALSMIWQTVLSTYEMHRKTQALLPEDLIIKINVRLAPEVKVFLGRPRLV